MKTTAWLTAALAAMACVSARAAEDPVLADVMKEDVKLADVTFSVEAMRAGPAVSRTECTYQVLDDQHCRIRMSSRAVVPGEEEGEEKLSSAEEVLILADGEALRFESARWREEGGIKLNADEKPIAEAPEVTFPAQLPVPPVAALCRPFKIEFDRRDEYEGRDAYYFRGEVQPPPPHGQQNPHGKDESGRHMTTHMKAIELVVDVETGLALSLVISGEREEGLTPTIVQRITDIRFDAGLGKDDFTYEDEGVTAKALQAALHPAEEE